MFGFIIEALIKAGTAVALEGLKGAAGHTFRRDVLLAACITTNGDFAKKAIVIFNFTPQEIQDSRVFTGWLKRICPRGLKCSRLSRAA
jgi:hypothetical protein